MSVKLLAEHHLEFLSIKGCCTGSSESTLAKKATLLEITCHGSIMLLLYIETLYTAAMLSVKLHLNQLI